MASLKDKIAAAKAEREAAEKLVADNADEIAAREELKREEDLAREARKKTLLLGLERRKDAAESAHPGKPIRSLHIEGSEHSFVLTSPSKEAFRAWEKMAGTVAVAKLQKKPPPDDEPCAVALAVAAVVDFDGMTDFSSATENGDTLIKFLTNNPSVRMDVVGAALELSKVATEERKSTG